VQITALGSTTVLTSVEIALADQSVTLSYASGEDLNNTVGSSTGQSATCSEPRLSSRAVFGRPAFRR
jgi:hypothetical protein